MAAIVSRIVDGFSTLTAAPSSPIRNVLAVVELALSVVGMIPPENLPQRMHRSCENDLGRNFESFKFRCSVNNAAAFLTNRLVVSALGFMVSNTLMRIPAASKALGSRNVQIATHALIGSIRLASFVFSMNATSLTVIAVCKQKKEKWSFPAFDLLDLDNCGNHSFSAYQQGVFSAVNALASAIIPNVGSMLMGLVRG